MALILMGADVHWVVRRLRYVLGVFSTPGASPLPGTSPSLPALGADWTVSPWDYRLDALAPRDRRLLRRHYMEPDRQDLAKTTLELTREVLSRVASGVFQDRALRLLLDLEWLAHTQLKIPMGGWPPKLYRDHLLHPAAVCALGWWMMGADGPEPLRLAQLVPLVRARCASAPGGPFDWEDVIKRSWVLAALCHDLYYPAEFVSYLDQQADGLSPSLWRHQVRRKEIKALFDGLEMGVLASSSVSGVRDAIAGREHSHAAMGAMNLIGAESGYPTISRRRKLIHELAADAVLHHHSEDPRRFRFEDHPLGYLLALADECHECGREMAVWSLSSGIRQVEFIPPVEDASVDQTGTTYKLKLRLAPDDDLARLTAAGFNLAKCREGKDDGFERLNPKDPAGDAINSFEFQVSLS